jgi:3-hydroxyacyl-CoA dehydrogenase
MDRSANPWRCDLELIVPTSTSPYLFNVPDLSDAQTYRAQIIEASQTPLPDWTAGETAQPRHAAVIGAGTMGRGIAYALARSGIDVELIDPSSSQLEAARADLARWDTRAGSTHAVVIRTTHQLASAAMADFVVEAVPEDMELKRTVFTALDTIAPPHAILASNTSTLDIDAIAAATQRPAGVIGTHFLLPAQVTELLEIVPGRLTAPRVTMTTARLARAIDKVAVIAGNCDGFIGNRLFDRWHQEAMYLVEEGASPEQIDVVLEGWGMAIGPFRTLDLIDNRLPWRVRQRRALSNSKLEQPRIGDRVCEAGFAGRAVGAGWYLYDPQTNKRRENPTINALASQCAAEQSIARRSLSDEEIVSRCMVAVINEGLTIVAEGHARCHSDIDLTFCLGYGFPTAQGGPLRLASRLDPETLSTLSRLCQEEAGRGKTRLITVSDLNALGAEVGDILSGAVPC